MIYVPTLGHTDPVIDYEQPARTEATLHQRLVAAGISADRARDLIVGGGVRVEGADEAERNPDASVPRPMRWHLAGS